MLELRPNCERCDTDLGPQSTNAFICTFECTFCRACAEQHLRGVCPNCAGELLPRPTRPEALTAGAPASTERVVSTIDHDAHVARRDDRPLTEDHPGVALHRYAEAWLAGDLTRLFGSYAPGFTLHYFGQNRFAGSHVGVEAAAAIMAEVSAVAPRVLRSVDEVLVGSEGGALVVTEELSRDGETAVVQRTFRYRVAEGLLQECWLLDTDQALIDRFWR